MKPHYQNKEMVDKIIYRKEYYRLLDYNEFHLVPLNFDYLICSCNDLEILKHIVNNSVNLESENWPLNERPIHIASQYKDRYEIVKLLIEKNANIDPKIKTKKNKNWIDYINKDNLKRLLEENVIQVRNCGYIIKKLQEEQTVSMCQDAIDHDPSNIQYVRDDLLRYFN